MCELKSLKSSEISFVEIVKERKKIDARLEALYCDWFNNFRKRMYHLDGIDIAEFKKSDLLGMFVSDVEIIIENFIVKEHKLQIAKGETK
jgi:hypothetical protein